MITYKPVKAAREMVKVYSEGKLVGAIYASPEGYYYRTTNGNCGTTQYTIDAVKKTLEEN